LERLRFFLNFFGKNCFQFHKDDQAKGKRKERALHFERKD